MLGSAPKDSGCRGWLVKLNSLVNRKLKSSPRDHPVVQLGCLRERKKLRVVDVNHIKR